MRVTRRRFLSVCALAAGTTALGMRERPLRWSGLALGAEASIELAGGEPAKAKQAIAAALDTVRRMERLFSIYDPESTISRLNRYGEVEAGPEFLRLAAITTTVHGLTGGLFDPTIQVLFDARRRGRLPVAADYSRVGWQHVLIGHDSVRFNRQGMSITFNGIAQGFATDRVSEVLQAHGYEATLVNIGEYRAGSLQAHIGVGREKGKSDIVVPLKLGAIATSEANGYTLEDGTSHILHPHETAFHRDWSSATVISSTAAMADAMSTALILSKGTDLAQKLRAHLATRIIIQDANSNSLDI